MKQFSKNDGQCFGLKLLLSINLRSNFKLQFIDWPTNLPIRQAKVRWKLKVVHSRVKMMHTMSQNWGTFFTQLRKGNLCFTVENKKVFKHFQWSLKPKNNFIGMTVCHVEHRQAFIDITSMREVENLSWAYYQKHHISLNNHHLIRIHCYMCLYILNH